MKISLNKKKSAFTLIELLVSITIIGIMAAMSISSYPKFSEQISVSSETYKILAFARETQIYGTSAVSTPGVKFVYAFEISKAAGTMKRYKIETPTDKTNTYYINSKVLDTEAAVYTLKSSYVIDKICVDTACTVDVDTAYGFFKRPNPEGRLVGLLGSNIGPDTATKSYDRFEVTIKSRNNPGIQKKIVILSTGQMYVNDW